MKRVTPILFALVAALCAHGGEIQVYFSPNGGCQEAVIREIDQARWDVKVQAYCLTDTAIANALRRAHQRRVKVEVILDASQSETNEPVAAFLQRTGIAVFIDAIHAAAHNKIMLIDAGTILTGSYNFTVSAEHSNAENLLVIKGFPEVTGKYRENYEKHRGHSEAYKPPSRAPKATAMPDDAEKDPIVFTTIDGKKYHRGDCPSLRQSKIPIRLSEAKRLRYTPCLRCKPPE